MWIVRLTTALGAVVVMPVDGTPADIETQFFANGGWIDIQINGRSQPQKIIKFALEPPHENAHHYQRTQTH